METKCLLKLTREKHLDHMVRVVPLIVFGYAAQSFIILRVSPTEFSQVSLSVLGCFLALMITAFITYDLKHQVKFFEGHLEYEFLGLKKTLRYEEIREVKITDPEEAFSNMSLISGSGVWKFYFVDDAERVKSFIESRPKEKATQRAA